MRSKPKLLLLGDRHSSYSIHLKQSEEILNFHPEICFLEMYKADNLGYIICRNFNRWNINRLRETWSFEFPFESYRPVIESIRRVRVRVLPLGYPESYVRYLENYLTKNGRLPNLEEQFMPKQIRVYGKNASRITAVAGIFHIITPIDGLAALHDFEIIYPQYLLDEVEGLPNIENILKGRFG